MTSSPPPYVPIAPLSDRDLGLQDECLKSLLQDWRNERDALSNDGSISHFLARLRREWAIETGVLERLYTVTESATKTLIEHGLDSALLTTSDTDKPAESVIRMIRDQEDAINGVYQLVAEKRPMTQAFIRQLHQVLTQHQPTCEAMDSLGRHVTVEMERGAYKKLPNLIGDSGRIAFAPPNLVETEMDTLVGLLNRYTEDEVPADVLAAWVHHRVTQIHPFQDGNGRIARCLASTVLIRADWFPLVVTRGDKVNYIEALRAADGGDLEPLVRLVGALQERSVRSALSRSEDSRKEIEHGNNLLGDIAARLVQRKRQLEAGQERLSLMADVLHGETCRSLRQQQELLQPILDRASLGYGCSVYAAPRGDERASPERNYIQVIAAAKKLDYFADLAAYRAWACLRIDSGRRYELLFDFHGLGKRRSSTQPLCCSAILVEKTRDEDSDHSTITRTEPLSEKPFTITSQVEESKLLQAFARWLEQAVERGLNMWKESL
jgi:Fic family protein